MTRERDVNAPGGGHNLRNYWVRGEGAAKIRWGTDGSFARCVRHLGDKVKNPQGLCAEYHKAATGEWPAEKGVESSMGEMIEAHGTHNQQDHDPTKGKSSRVPSLDSPTHRKNFTRMAELERKADSDGVDESETRELRKLRKIYGDLYDPSIDDERGSVDEDLEDLDAEDREDELSMMEDRIIALRRKKQRGELSADEAKELEKLRNFYRLPADKFALQVAAGKKRKRDDDDDDKPDTYAVGDGDEPWKGVLSVEGIESGDGRLFALGSLDWEKPPQPLMYQPANVGGHNASIMVGQIQSITRHGSRIRGEGTVFGSALRSEHGENIRHMMETGGVSVDVDNVKDADVEMVFADDESGDGSNMFAKPETTIFHRGRIRGATLVAFPAFVEAKLAFTGDVLTASGESCGCDLDEDPLVASVHTITIPNQPKAEWFNEPTDVKITGALTITDEGRVYGIVAPADTNHRSYAGKKVPRNLDFSRFHKGETIVEGGGRVVTGVITASCGHAATQNYGTLNNRLEHYDNSCSVLANIRVGYSRQGHIWAAGALNPGADPRQVAQALGCALSLDVQPHPDRPMIREFIAAHLVPVPGFPLARTQASVTYEDGLITASSVPVAHVARPTYVDGPRDDTLYDAFATFKNTLAESLGLDPRSRKDQLMRELELV